MKNSQESACVSVSLLIKLQVSAYNFIKKETLTQVFSSEFYEIFIGHLRVTASAIALTSCSQTYPRNKAGVKHLNMFIVLHGLQFFRVNSSKKKIHLLKHPILYIAKYHYFAKLFAEILLV